MPLSDHEQRLLEQIERALYAEDPKFASTVRATDLRHYYRRRVLRGAFLCLVGLGGLAAGLALHILVAVAVGAIVAALGGAVSLAAWRRMGHGTALAKARRAKARGAKTSFRERMQQRWERRFEERNF